MLKFYKPSPTANLIPVLDVVRVEGQNIQELFELAEHQSGNGRGAYVTRCHFENNHWSALLVFIDCEKYLNSIKF